MTSLPLVRLAPFYPGQWGISQSDMPLGLRTMSRGVVLYVDVSHANASDSNDGTNPDAPLRTLTAAIGKATTNQDDFILVHGLTNALETWPLAVNKHKLHIYSSAYALGVDFVKGSGRIITPPADTAAFYITGDRAEIAGFDISAGATHACFEFSTAAQSWGAHIHHNRLGWMGGARDGIDMTGAVDKVHFLIHDNDFNDKLTRDGIRIEQNSTRSEIFNNTFRRVAGVGINLVTLCTDIYAIHDNIFNPVADAATGGAIFCNANSVGCMFYGNKAMHDKAAMAQVPYRDLGANHWGLNYYGILAIMPVTV